MAKKKGNNLALSKKLSKITLWFIGVVIGLFLMFFVVLKIWVLTWPKCEGDGYSIRYPKEFQYVDCLVNKIGPVEYIFGASNSFLSEGSPELIRVVVSRNERKGSSFGRLNTIVNGRVGLFGSAISTTTEYKKEIRYKIYTPKYYYIIESKLFEDSIKNSQALWYELLLHLTSRSLIAYK